MSHCCAGAALELEGPVLTRLPGHEETLSHVSFSE